MKILKTLSVVLALSASFDGVSATTLKPEKEIEVTQWGTIDAQGLESLIKAKVPMTLVDARADKWFDGILITGAKRLPADSTREMIEKTLPHKEQLVVVYCAGEHCPASKNLSKRLVESGYESVIDYLGGLQDWMARHKPVQKEPI